jgi:hypothetical protein
MEDPMDELFCKEIERQLSRMSGDDGRRADMPFLSMVQHVRAFGEASGKFPDGSSPDRHEALLGRWLQRQRDLAAAGILSRTLHSFADTVLGRQWAAQSYR